MKTVQIWLVTMVMGLVSGFAAIAQVEPENPSTHQDHLDNVAAGCPEKFEDVFVEMAVVEPANVIPADFWGPVPDDATVFETAYIANNTINGVAPTAAEVQAVMADQGPILFECNAHRLNLLQYMVNANAGDTNVTLDVIAGISNAIDLASGRWETGDVRSTGREFAAEHWVLLDGKTIGAPGSGADHEGDQYEDLFNLIKLWSFQAPPGKTWGNLTGSGTIALPDLRGRAIYGKNNMGAGGSPIAPTLNPDPAADTLAVEDIQAGIIGGIFGKELRSLTALELPTHTHTIGDDGLHAHNSVAEANHIHGMSNSVKHDHTVDLNGAHAHHLRTSAYTGSGAGGTSTYMDGKRRTNYQNTITHSVNGAPDHNHQLSDDGQHKHTIYGEGGHDHQIQNSTKHNHTNSSAGASQAFNATSPGIAFNVEMKL